MFPVNLGWLSKFALYLDMGGGSAKRLIAFVHHAQFPALRRAFTFLLDGDVSHFLEALPRPLLHRIKEVLIVQATVKSVLKSIDPDSIMYKDTTVWDDGKAEKIK